MPLLRRRLALGLLLVAAAIVWLGLSSAGFDVEPSASLPAVATTKTTTTTTAAATTKENEVESSSRKPTYPTAFTDQRQEISPTSKEASLPLSALPVLNRLEVQKGLSFYSDYRYLHPNFSTLVAGEGVLLTPPTESNQRPLQQLHRGTPVFDYPCFKQDRSGKSGTLDDDANLPIRLFIPWKGATAMTPNPVPCNIPCILEDDPRLVNGSVKQQSQTLSIDAYVVDTNGAMVNEAYNWSLNPKRFYLIAVNIENIKGRRALLKKSYGLRYLAKPWSENWWSNFDLVVSYESGSDIPLNYFQWAFCREPSFAMQRAKMMQLAVKGLKSGIGLENGTSKTVDVYSAWPKVKSAPILFLSRNCDFTANRRVSTVRKLSSLIPIDAVGKCLNSNQMADREPLKLPRQCQDGKADKKGSKACLIASYHFYISFENSISFDYVTEKVYEPLMVGTIPIYLGAPNIEAYLPTTHSAILMTDFESLSDLAYYLRCLLRTPHLYQHYLDWMKRPFFSGFNNFREWYPPMCQVCNAVRDWKSNRTERMEGLGRRRTSARAPRVVNAIPKEVVGSQRPFPECLPQPKKR